MDEIYRNFRVLGLESILNILAEKVECSDTKSLALSMRPSSDIGVVRQLLRETDEAYLLFVRFGGPSFTGLCDIKSGVSRAQGGSILTMRELILIGDVLGVFNCILEFRTRSGANQTLLASCFDKVLPNKYLRDKIKSAIIFEDELADEASPELADIRRRMKLESNRAREQLERLVSSAAKQKYLQEAIITIRDDRFVVPVKAECRREIPGLVHDTSSSGATLFVEPMSVVEINNAIRILVAREKKEIERILRDLSREVGEFAEGILASYEATVELNLLFAKAELAYDMKAAVPTINNKGTIALKNARHPLIDSQKVVPIDIALGNNFDTLVITGPNTGGKTVSLKTVGLLSLMAMCGLMIPADESSNLCIFNNIFADIGDEQSIEQSLSTFSAHIANIVKILHAADAHSLVLLDELGAGTDPVEGAALAVSILEELKARGARTIATTHYSELKAYALSENGIENASCEFDVTTLAPTYKLLIGVPGSSNAFAISRRLGLPECVINSAERFISEDNARFENVVRGLEESRKKLENERLELEKLTGEARLERDLVRLELEKVHQARERELNAAKEQAATIVARTTAQAQDLLEQVRELEKQKNVDHDALRQLKTDMRRLGDAADPVESRLNKGYVLPRKLKPGDFVLIVDIDKKGTVVEISDVAGDALVQAGIIKMRVPITNIRLLQENPVHVIHGKNTRTVKSKAEASVSRELDLRGQNAMDAIMELDSFIDMAMLTGVNQLVVIHGKGTGVLRREVHVHLKRHPAVRTYRLGVYGEGESGVTIVELK